MIKTIVIFLIATLLLTGCSAAVDMKTPAIASADAAVSESITEQQAQDIALEHAGLSADQVTWLHTEYELDDGVPLFEVQFRYDGWEYDYEIHAETGAITAYDRDRN